MTTLSKKMIGYALGRTVRGSDRPLVEVMAQAGGGASFSDLAIRIVTSRQFRNRVGGEDAGPAPKVPAGTRAEGAAKAGPSQSGAGNQ